MALPPSWAWVLLGCASASLAGAFNLSNLYPPLWQESPGQFSDYGVENGKYVIDPWVFTDRMGMYKILLNRTATYFAKFGPENEQNLLWGLPLQHGWQYRSGRLADPERRTNCGYEPDPLCISVDSWWADMNYFLSVLPFLAALDSGILGTSPNNVTLLPPPKDQMRFCYNVSGCRSSFPDTMNQWKIFFQYMQSPWSTFEELLKYLWDAHTTSLKDPPKIFEDRHTYYSEKEANFGDNWAVAVLYLAACRFPTTLIRTYKFQKGLPPRILNSTDIAPFIRDFTELQNIVLVALKMIGDVNRVTGSLTLNIWKILMMTQTARKEFLLLFENVFESFPTCVLAQAAGTEWSLKVGRQKEPHRSSVLQPVALLRWWCVRDTEVTTPTLTNDEAGTWFLIPKAGGYRQEEREGESGRLCDQLASETLI
ncbi:protein LEG1 homolog [Fukomys damarensis]|uniref:protein LEG1 homolog n=1 Tax=Fukomys damarensis TaxID=885580 RepID=UPI0014550359|nr:protein LEG1 homolog [Fukomys damarensis]